MSLVKRSVLTGNAQLQNFKTGNQGFFECL